MLKKTSYLNAVYFFALALILQRKKGGHQALFGRPAVLEMAAAAYISSPEAHSEMFAFGTEYLLQDLVPLE